MDKLRKLFGKVNLTWKKIIILAIIAAVYTAVMAILPIAQDTSFSAPVATFELWILFGIFIIMNSKTAKDSALKCFVFFLISQPLIYLLQIPFSALGGQLLSYYPYWFVWTLLTLPMGYIGWYMKKDEWWDLLILTPIMIFLGFHFGLYLGLTVFSFPRYLLATIFCAVTTVLYPLAIFKNKSIKYTGALIGVVIIIGFSIYSALNPTVYETDVLINNGSTGAVFDDSYKTYLSDNSFGTVEIRFYEQGLDDWVVHAKFKKAGKTQIILESPEDEKQTFDINIINSHLYEVE